VSLIFDRFPNLKQARAFATEVKKRYRLNGQVFISAYAAQEHDPFPWVLDPPIVHIERPETESALETESAVEHLVTKFGGTFAGT
jgi:hypothetical protein